MDWFPDPMKPLSEKSAADLANEYWMFNEVTKGDSGPEDFEEFWSDDLDREFEDEWDSEFEDFGFGDDPDIPAVFAPLVEDEPGEEKKKIKAVKAVKREEPVKEPEEEATVSPVPPAQNGPGGAKLVLRLIFWLIVIAVVIYTWGSFTHSRNETRKELDRISESKRNAYSISLSNSRSRAEQSSLERSSSLSALHRSQYAGYITRKSTSRTKEDFYGVDDYVDAADFADEMHDEFDDWEDAYEYYEEYAE